jgi:chlorite dismutase
MDTLPIAHPPATLEGWYAFHQVFSIDHDAGHTRVDSTPLSQPKDGGWSAFVRLIGSRGDIMIMHFRPTLEGIDAAQREVDRLPIRRALNLEYSFLSVTEAGLYHLTAQLAKQAAERGGAVGDETFTADLERRSAEERETPHVQRRLYPQVPDGMPYVCFYPMNKRRQPEQNWYSLSLEERSRLMWSHGLTGRRYSGRVLQIITGAIGFDAWEWGVTLFAKDAVDFKKLVTEMRFDEASAKYADFGEFFVGKLTTLDGLRELFETN